MLDDFIWEVSGAALIDDRTEQLVQGITAEFQRLCRPLRQLVKPAAYGLGPGQFNQPLHRPVGGREGHLPWQALFKTGAGLRSQTHASGAAAHLLGREHRRFQPEVAGAIVHGAGGSPDHSGQGDRLVGIGDHEGFFIQVQLAAIERLESFALLSLAQAESLQAQARPAQVRQSVAVIGVEGLTRFEHHQVGDVHHVVDRAQTCPFQPLLQPPRRRADTHTTQGREAEQPPSSIARWAAGPTGRGSAAKAGAGEARVRVEAVRAATSRAIPCIERPSGRFAVIASSST